MNPQFVETIKIQDGQVQCLPYHQERMERTIRCFFPLLATDGMPCLKRLLVPQEGVGIVKARVVYGACGLEEITYAPYVKREIRSLKVVIDNTIDYCFKNTDRSRINGLLAKRGDCDDIVIVKNGLVTDTSFTNIAMYDGSRWLTPKHPLLHGVKRASLLDLGLIKEAEVSLDDLMGAYKIRLFNAMIDFGEIELFRL